jgi:hypothetical protein
MPSRGKWRDYDKNRRRPPFQLGQRIRYLSPNADQTAKTITWVSDGATCRSDQLVSVAGSAERFTASVFVDADP